MPIDTVLRQGTLQEPALRTVAMYQTALLEWNAGLGDNGVWTATLHNDGSHKTGNGATLNEAIERAHKG